MSDRLDDYDFSLPPELIASRPAPRRDGSRLMVVERSSGRISHHVFREFPAMLQPGELLVLNNSRVIPARLFTPDGRLELLLIADLGGDRWRAFVRPGRLARPGRVLEVAGTTATVAAVEDDGCRILHFAAPPDLATHGRMPIPPYLGREDDAEDRERYQTVYASVAGSVAAPTAGLHFTKEMLASLPHAFVTLHVGPGTFLPVRTDDLSLHHMHAEHYEVSQEAAEALNAAHRLLTVGTTTLRVLESLPPGPVSAGCGSTEIFIRPGHRFLRTQALLTNFHLPKSTLFVLVCALAGHELMHRAYAEAVRQRYRFFSYGDCMLIR